MKINKVISMIEDSLIILVRTILLVFSIKDYSHHLTHVINLEKNEVIIDDIYESSKLSALLFD